MANVKKVVCPHCKKPVQKEGNSFWPFCSERCKLIDLGQWASGKYSIPGELVSKEDEDDEGKNDEGKNNVD